MTDTLVMLKFPQTAQCRKQNMVKFVRTSLPLVQMGDTVQEEEGRLLVLSFLTLRMSTS